MSAAGEPIAVPKGKLLKRGGIEGWKISDRESPTERAGLAWLTQRQNEAQACGAAEADSRPAGDGLVP